MSKKVTIKRTNKHTVTRVVWFITCNICDHKSYHYHNGTVIAGDGKGEDITFCHGCMKKYDLTYKGATAKVKI
jgi:hypothetical protein